MRSATALLEVFLVAVVVALAITLASASPAAKVVALAAVTPIVVLCLVFIRYCRRGMAWSFAGASVLGAVGVVLRLVVSTQPKLEVGGGLPLPVSAAYVCLGVAVSVSSSLSYLQLRRRAGG